ncbi:MAG: Ca-activated chloride channel [Actinomycetota bacterium]|jgi:Ca-activated chloride channel family protein|nr:Ca-activated chloride channel [Actinomycetota bacterium]
MSGLSFDSPGRLWVLALVAGMLVAYVLLQRRRNKYAVRLPGLDLLASIAPRLGWRRHLPAALMLLALTSTTAAFAEPRANVQVPRERATIIVALDVSYSMSATDVSPDRITAAKAAAARFVNGLPARFNVGLVAFSGAAAVVVPATQEHTAVTEAINGLALGNGTAIGEAVSTSLDAVTQVPGASTAVAAPAHIVLLSDGANTVGRPLQAGIDEARAAGVPVSTIAYGTAAGVVQVGRELVQVPVDGPALADLADQTGGRGYSAESGDELKDVYADIGSAIGTTTERREVGATVAGIALLLAVGAAASATALTPRLT